MPIPMAITSALAVARSAPRWCGNALLPVARPDARPAYRPMVRPVGDEFDRSRGIEPRSRLDDVLDVATLRWGSATPSAAWMSLLDLLARANDRARETGSQGLDANGACRRPTAK